MDSETGVTVFGTQVHFLSLTLVDMWYIPTLCVPSVAVIRQREERDAFCCVMPLGSGLPDTGYGGLVRFVVVQEKIPMKTILILAYQSFGVVYGDLSTSPLYVYRSTFSDRLHMYESDDEILGVLSFIFWTLTIIPVIKYVFIVLSASDNGEGEAFLHTGL